MCVRTDRASSYFYEFRLFLGLLIPHREVYGSHQLTGQRVDPFNGVSVLRVWPHNETEVVRKSKESSPEDGRRTGTKTLLQDLPLQKSSVQHTFYIVITHHDLSAVSNRESLRRS